MPSLSSFAKHWPINSQTKPLYSISLMLFFWAIADSILSFVLPLMIVENGYTKTEMGLIIGSSSLCGAVFDLILSKIIKQPNWRKLYFVMLLFTLAFVVLLMGAGMIWVYLLAMAVWGIYWDLFGFANADFISHHVPKTENASAFGVLNVFVSLGKLLGPVIAGVALAAVAIRVSLWYSVVFFGFSCLFFILVNVVVPKKTETHHEIKSLNWLAEIRIWRSLGKQLSPLLILTFLIFVYYAFFGTIGPLLAEESGFGALAGQVMVAHFLPSLLSGWVVGSLVKKFGKKRTALYSFLLGAAIICLLPVAAHGLLAVVIIFISAFFVGISVPAVSGAYADYIRETLKLEPEIQSITDYFYNLGWAIGPALAGSLSDSLGIPWSFGVMGAVCVGITLWLIRVTPKKISIRM